PDRRARRRRPRERRPDRPRRGRTPAGRPGRQPQRPAVPRRRTPPGAPADRQCRRPGRRPRRGGRRGPRRPPAARPVPIQGTDIDPLLRDLGCRTLIVTGVSADVAVPDAVFDAVNRGCTVVLPTDAVAGVPAGYTRAMI